MVTDYIDSVLSGLYPEIHFFGLAELVTKSEERFPATVNGRVKVSLDNQYSGICYHRIINNSPAVSEELSFGIRPTVQDNVTIRTVLAYKISEFDEMFRYEFENAMPRTIRLTGYDPIFIEPGDANEDHEQIAIDESLQTPYEKHRVTWNIYSFDNVCELIICDE